MVNATAKMKTVLSKEQPHTSSLKVSPITILFPCNFPLAARSFVYSTSFSSWCDLIAKSLLLIEAYGSTPTNDHGYACEWTIRCRSSLFLAKLQFFSIFCSFFFGKSMSFGSVYNVGAAPAKEKWKWLKIILLNQKKWTSTEKLMAPKILNWFWLIMSYSSFGIIKRSRFRGSFAPFCGCCWEFMIARWSEYN